MAGAAPGPLAGRPSTNDGAGHTGLPWAGTCRVTGNRCAKACAGQSRAWWTSRQRWYGHRGARTAPGAGVETPLAAPAPPRTAALLTTSARSDMHRSQGLQQRQAGLLVMTAAGWQRHHPERTAVVSSSTGRPRAPAMCLTATKLRLSLGRSGRSTSPSRSCVSFKCLCCPGSTRYPCRSRKRCPRAFHPAPGHPAACP